MNLGKLEIFFKRFIQLQVIKKVVQTQFALRSAEILHRLTFKQRYEFMAQAIEQFKKCDNKKPKSQIKKEIILCKKFWGCYPLHYYRYGLYKKNKKLSERELLNYIPEFFFYYLFLPFHNPRKYENLAANKNMTEQLFRNLAIPQIPTICKLIGGHICTDELEKIGFDAIEQELIKHNYSKIFVKPIYGEGGHGIHIFNKNNGGQYVNKDDDIFNETFLNKIGAQNDYILQPGIEQDSELSKVYSHSINTFRIVTENKEGDVRILCAILRFGRNGSQVDNSDQGGIFVTIDTDTGKIGNYATSMQGECLRKHPDTNIIFKGYKILRWDEIKKFTIDCAKKIPQLTYLGWDITLTKKSPLAIEIHYGFSLDGLQVIFGGLREIIGINVPKFYWINKGKRI